MCLQSISIWNWLGHILYIRIGFSLIYAQVPSPCKRVLYFIALRRFKPTLCPLSTSHTLSHYIFWQLPCENCILREVYASYLPWRGLILAPITHCLVGIRSEKVLAWQLALAALAAAGSSNSTGVGWGRECMWHEARHIWHSRWPLSLFLSFSVCQVSCTQQWKFSHILRKYFYIYVSVHMCVCWCFTCHLLRGMQLVFIFLYAFCNNKRGASTMRRSF